MVKNLKFTYDQAAVMTGIPKSTLFDHVHNKVEKVGRGRNRLLTINQENIIKLKLKKLKKSKNFPKSICQLSKIIFQFAMKKKIRPLITKKNKMNKSVGRKWLALFLRRNEKL